MRKTALFMALVLLLVGAGLLNAGLDAVPHVTLGGLLRISGTGKNIRLADISDNGTVEDSAGFDTKESMRQLYSNNVNVSETGISFKDGTDEQKIFYDLIKHEVLPEEFKVSSALPYREFNDKTWADMKFRSLAKGRNISILPAGRMVTKPIRANTIPSAKNGLLNASYPLEITTYSDKITLGFNEQISGLYSARLLDNKGKELGGTRTSGNHDTTEITLPYASGNYYLEFSDRGSKVKKYCYILLRAEPDDIQPAEDPEVSQNIARMRAANEKGNKIAEDYTTRNNIQDKEQLTDKDTQAIVDEFTASEMSSAPVSQRQHVMSQAQVIQEYMREHNIPSMAQLTKKDADELRRRIMKNASLSWPDEFRAIADDYMTQHNISNYEDLTEKDLKTIERLAKKKMPSKRKK